ncbi:MAG: cation-translocating P-type ATPase [Gammaproteobacteria bacterium]|nr:cation-translocating P-type ATPase [Gammaproteobacteria bacterium]
MERTQRNLDGLSHADATERLQREGSNELVSPLNRSLRDIALEVLREPMFLLLGAGGAIYLLLGNVHEALVLLSSVFVILTITIYQERRTERALEALRDLASPRALVIRNGERIRISGREVVRGDVLVIQEGDRVPADAVLWTVSDLRADESLLTGESVPVNKIAWDGLRQVGAAGGEDQPFVFSGTMVVRGHGLGEVIATGATSQIGRVGQALSGISKGQSPLQLETAKIVQSIALIGLALCLLVVVLYGLTRGSWLDGVLAGITLAMAILPEEFPVVLTVFLALGAWRISKERVLTRQISAIETLGAANVLCVDKTGTLTMNRMVLKRLVIDDERIDLDKQVGPVAGRFEQLLLTSIYASEQTPFDPMEKALHDAGRSFLNAGLIDTRGMKLEREYALSPKLLVHCHAWRLPNHHGLATAKGAPEAIASVCRLSRDRWERVQTRVDEMAADGLRVLGVARAPAEPRQWPAEQTAFKFEFLGLLGLADPVRPTVHEALTHCYHAGIRVVMITGDYPATAKAIGCEIGLNSPDRHLTGDDIAQLSDSELGHQVNAANIFARVSPDQKLRLVRALKANGDIVAMTGDGVNDAPALKAAHIGIAMGGRGTDVAREAASLVLLDDEFASIVSAVRVGRRIYHNIRNAMCYILAVHIPIVGMSLIPIFLDWPLIFYPVHIVFLEFVIDPACSIAFEAEPEQPGLMQRPPRLKEGHLFNLRTVSTALLQGLTALLAVALLYAWALDHGRAEATARAMAFATLVFGNVGLILANRSPDASLITMLRVRNPALGWLISGAIVGLACVIYVPGMNDMFKFAPLTPGDLLASLGAAVVGLQGYEFYKAMNRSRQRNNP